MLKKSIWEGSAVVGEYPALSGEKSVEALVIGGGLCGIVTAAELVRRGFKTALVTDNRLLSGNTSRTTARITVQHDLIYDRLICSHGEELAQKYYRAAQYGLDKIKEDIDALDIGCNAAELEAVMYSASCWTKGKIKREAKAYEKLGIPFNLNPEIEFDTVCKAAVGIPGQLVINPVKYLAGILKNIKDKLEIYENSRVYDIRDNTAVTREGNIKAKHIVMATNFPFINVPGWYFFRLYRHFSYCAAYSTARPLKKMYGSVDNKGLEIRPYNDGESDYIVTGGMEHKTACAKKKFNYYSELNRESRRLLSLNNQAAEWSAQDAMSMDLLPVAGRYAKDKLPGLYLISGMNKWGFTLSRTGAEVICDLIEGKTHALNDVYSPERITPVSSAAQFIPHAAEITGSLITTLLDIPEKLSGKVKPGEGAVVGVKGERTGIYKDTDGKVYAVDATCPHLKCAMKFNKEEKTWDCPCHGSRFNVYGELLDGPATNDTRKIDEAKS